jgi:hypothetical protein
MSVDIANKKSLSIKHRRTYHIQDDLHEKVKAYAYWERISIYEVVNTALEQFLGSWDCKSAIRKYKASSRKINQKSN